jgi:hypothetical protein
MRICQRYVNEYLVIYISRSTQITFVDKLSASHEPEVRVSRAISVPNRQRPGCAAG